MSKRHILATAIFASAILGSSIAMACPFHDASADGQQAVVAQGDQQPSSPTAPATQPSTN